MEHPTALTGSGLTAEVVVWLCETIDIWAHFTASLHGSTVQCSSSLHSTATPLTVHQCYNLSSWHLTKFDSHKLIAAVI